MDILDERKKERKKENYTKKERKKERRKNKYTFLFFSFFLSTSFLYFFIFSYSISIYLKSDKHFIGLTDDNTCTCGEIENAEHYLLEGGTNLVSKVKMLDSITDLLGGKGLIDDIEINIDLLLHGSEQLTLEDNNKIASYVQTFIGESKRFIF